MATWHKVGVMQGEGGSLCLLIAHLPLSYVHSAHVGKSQSPFFLSLSSILSARKMTEQRNLAQALSGLKGQMKMLEFCS
jgi:hypothetical protein